MLAREEHEKLLKKILDTVTSDTPNLIDLADTVEILRKDNEKSLADEKATSKKLEKLETKIGQLKESNINLLLKLGSSTFKPKKEEEEEVKEVAKSTDEQLDEFLKDW